MVWMEFVLPGSLLLLKFVLKLFIGKALSLPDFINSIIALPVDLVFLSASLFIGFSIANPSSVKGDLILTVVIIIVSVLVTFLWRVSETNFVREKHYLMMFSAALNFLISVSALFYAVLRLSSGASI